MHATAADRNEERDIVGGLSDGGVGPLSTYPHRHLLLSIFHLVRPNPPYTTLHSHILILVLQHFLLSAFSHSQWLRRSLNFPHQSRASYL